MADADPSALAARFAVPGQLEVREQTPGFTLIDVFNAAASATIAVQGAQLLAWAPPGQQAVIWLSPHARFANGKSVRGGVPVCWPWFGPHADDVKLPAHGFARTESWEMIGHEVSLEPPVTRVRFRLRQTAAMRHMWCHAAELELHIAIGASLVMQLVTRNTGSDSFILGQALHTYFAVSDIRAVSIAGLEGCSYLDKVGPEQRRVQEGVINFSGETDRIYLDTTGDCVIEDPGLQRRIRVSKQGSRSTVVWNPWIDKSARLGDMGEDGYLRMVCVESANAADDVITLAPGAEHCLAVHYSVETP